MIANECLGYWLICLWSFDAFLLILELKVKSVAPTSIDYNAPAMTSANHAVDITTLNVTGKSLVET